MKPYSLSLGFPLQYPSWFFVEGMEDKGFYDFSSTWGSQDLIHAVQNEHFRVCSKEASPHILDEFTQPMAPTNVEDAFYLVQEGQLNLQVIS